MKTGNGGGRFKRSPDVAHRIVDGEAVIVDPVTQEVHILNQTGSFIWTLMDGTLSTADLAGRLSDSFEVDVETARKDVGELLCTLMGKKLIVMEGER